MHGYKWPINCTRTRTEALVRHTQEMALTNERELTARIRELERAAADPLGAT